MLDKSCSYHMLGLDPLPVCPKPASDEGLLVDGALSDAVSKAAKSVVKGVVSVVGQVDALVRPDQAQATRTYFTTEFGIEYSKLLKQMLKFQMSPDFDKAYKAANNKNKNSDKLSPEKLSTLKRALQDMDTMVTTFNDRNASNNVSETESTAVDEVE